MFNKKSSIDNELELEMEKSLFSSAVEEEGKFQKLAQAVDMLNVAAEIFDDAGWTKQSLEITSLLESIAKKTSKKKKKPSKEDDTESLTSEKMVNNLKTKGWVFNADDMEVEEDEDDFEDE